MKDVIRLRHACPKCGNDRAEQTWRGPRFVVPTLGVQRETLSFTCEECGYVMQVPCADARQVTP